MVDIAPLESERLRYRCLTEADLDTFHALAMDRHIRAYMLDGSIVERSRASSILQASDALFEDREVGLWLVFRDEEAIGFCGFHVFEKPDPEPQILYAFTEPHTGLGYATEVTRALVERVAALGWDRVATAVDEPNVASIRVLRKVGFSRMFSFPGAFGRQFYFSMSLQQPLPENPFVRSLLDTRGIGTEREVFESLVDREGVRIERIVSTGQCTGEGIWYEQDEHEWVLVLQGAARIAYADGRSIDLAPGDALLIPAGLEHRVEWTEAEPSTIWLALFFH
jgi:cupin 2 domain-containing protein